METWKLLVAFGLGLLVLYLSLRYTRPEE